MINGMILVHTCLTLVTFTVDQVHHCQEYHLNVASVHMHPAGKYYIDWDWRPPFDSPQFPKEY